MADIVSVHFSNMSNQTLNRDAFSLSKGGSAWDWEPLAFFDTTKIKFTKSPEKVMTKSSGTGFIIAGSKGLLGITLEDIVEISFDVINIWQCENSGYRFGIKVHVASQLLTIGTGPSWQVMFDKKPSGSDADWITPDADQTAPYTFPSDNGLQITATPLIDTDSLSLDVYISNSKTV